MKKKAIKKNVKKVTKKAAKTAALVTRSVRFDAKDIKAAEAKGIKISAFCREALAKAVK